MNTIKKQVKTYRKDLPNGDVLIAEVRHDDSCGNGHNTFAITGRLYDRDISDGGKVVTNAKGQKRWLGSCGCIHEEIAENFPELAPMIKWHLCSTDGPMHYLANTLYFAGNKDCNGKASGDVLRYRKFIKFQGFPFLMGEDNRGLVQFLELITKEDINNLTIVEHIHARDPETFKPKYSFGECDKWHEAPFNSISEAEQWLEAIKTIPFEIVKIPTAFSSGKERELDNARKSAIWPDATEDDLTSPDLRERLIARLPALIEEFKRDVESLGFTF